jgi:hypothetical protein
MKKRISFLSLIIISLALLTGCSKNTPEAVAKDWLTAFYHQDYDAAKKLSTEETKVMLSTIQGFSGSLADSIKQKAKQVTITIKSVKTEGDKATVTFIASNTPNQEEPPLKLVKQSEKWLVQFTKSDFKPTDSGESNAGNGGATITVDSPTPAAAPADSAAMAPDTTKQQ